MDNVVLSQYNEASDFVDITSVPGTGTKADISAMSGEVSLADSQAIDSAKALYSYLTALDKAGQVLFGHQNDTHKHVTSREGVYSDTKDITGSISGLVENIMHSLQHIWILLLIMQRGLVIYLCFSVHSMRMMAAGSGGVLLQQARKHIKQCTAIWRII